MDATSLPPRTHLPPTEIANDTFLLHDHVGEGCAPMSMPVNTLVIRAAEPIVVDTGLAEHRERFLADVFSLVEPDDVRWVFVSHDDVDHTGNLDALLAAAPKAIVVVSWQIRQRMGASLTVPLRRQRWIADDEQFDVGDRTLATVRPPVFDAPTTRGLFDPTTGVYWSSDAFATPVPTPTADVASLDPAQWEQGMIGCNHLIAPWITLVDDGRFQATVDRIEAIGPSCIAGSHTPLIGRLNIDAALATTRRTPSTTPPQLPDQALLDQLRHCLGDG